MTRDMYWMIKIQTLAYGHYKLTNAMIVECVCVCVCMYVSMLNFV